MKVQTLEHCIVASLLAILVYVSLLELFTPSAEPLLALRQFRAAWRSKDASFFKVAYTAFHVVAEFLLTKEGMGRFAGLVYMGLLGWVAVAVGEMKEKNQR